MDEARVNYDAIIIGAGPAGSLTALLLARSGVRTLLVDKGAFPRHKVCGCCLAPAGQAVLERCGAGGVIAEALAVRSMSIRLGGRTIDVDVPTYRTISRSAMDTRLLQLARDAGCDVRLGAGASVERDGLVRIAGESVRSKVVIVADGVGGSALREWDAFAWDVRPASRIGVGTVIERAPGVTQNAITMCVGERGYCGIAPLGDGGWAVAAALDASAVRERGVCGGVSRVLGSCGLDGVDVGGASWAGAPALTRTRRCVESGFGESGRVFVVGDGVGYVEPFTGEGMSWALMSAEMGAQHAMASLRGAYSDGAWTRDVGSRLAREKRACRAVTGVLRRPSLTRACARVASWSPALSSFVARRVVAA